MTGQEEFLKIDVGLREEVIHPPAQLPARTLLADPNTSGPVLPPFTVQTLTRLEAYAEKVRAALTRMTPAIRDFFDVDNAVEGRLLAPLDAAFVELLRKKLSITPDPVDLSPARVQVLQGQLEPELRPVLRQEDYDSFLLDRVVGLLHQVADHVRRG